MNWTSLALWAALALSGLATGALMSRWNSTAAGVPPRLDGILLAGAAASVVAWFANAGALLSNSGSSALLTAYVPIDASAAFRLSVLWATLPGAALTLGALALICAVLVPVRSAERLRFTGVLAGIALASFVVAVWFLPRAGSMATAILPFLQSPWAAIAPLAVLLSLTALAVAVSSVAARQASYAWILLAWGASTAAIAAEQVARSQLGIGPRDGVVLGSASGGLILWLVTSALMHRRVRRLFSGEQSIPGERSSTWLAHVGAAMFALSFAAHAVATRSTVELTPGQTVAVADPFRREWALANQGVSRYDAEGADILSATIEARPPGGSSALLTPEIRDYHRADGAHLDNSVSLRRSTGRGLTAMRLLLIEADSLDVTQVRVTFQPLPLLWLAGVALIFASVVAIVTNLSRRTRMAPE